MRFFTGDQAGNIKSLSFSPADGSTDLKTILSRDSAVQRLDAGGEQLAAAYADGSCLIYGTSDCDHPKVVQEWREERLKPDQKFLGIHMTTRGIYTCTSNGCLGLQSTDFHLASIPTRLRAWSLSPDHHSFAYGGEEVDLSVWDIEKAFTSIPDNAEVTHTKKRKRDAPLFSAEVWRAKNLPNDHLGLRQPVQIAALVFLSTNSSLITGTLSGDVRRYDIRAGRTPISNWKGVGKKGITVLQPGREEHELFIADQLTSLCSLDLRTGKVLYGYKGIAGAVTSLSVGPSYVASTALDRYIRIHSTFAPPADSKDQSNGRGAEIAKVYMRALPTTVVWDRHTDSPTEMEVDEDVWLGLKVVGK